MIKFILKYLILIIISLLGVFWFGIFNNFRRFLSLAFDLKNFLDSKILPFGLQIPVPDNLTRPYSWFNTIVDGFSYYSNIKYGVPQVSIPYVRKFTNAYLGGNSNNQTNTHVENKMLSEDYLINNTIVNSISDSVNISTVNHDVIEATDFLIHLFNEFNLFC